MSIASTQRLPNGTTRSVEEKRRSTLLRALERRTAVEFETGQLRIVGISCPRRLFPCVIVALTATPGAQFGKAKNSIVVKQYTLARRSPLELELHAVARGAKSYTLVTSDKEDADAWEVAIKSWLVSGLAANELIANNAPVVRDASKMSGWLLKKGQRRWFFIESG